MSDIPFHQEDSRRISPPGDIPTDGAVANTSGGWELGTPTFVDVYVRGGFGVGEDVCRPQP